MGGTQDHHPLGMPLNLNHRRGKSQKLKNWSRGHHIMFEFFLQGSMRLFNFCPGRGLPESDRASEHFLKARVAPVDLASLRCLPGLFWDSRLPLTSVSHGVCGAARGPRDRLPSHISPAKQALSLRCLRGANRPAAWRAVGLYPSRLQMRGFSDPAVSLLEVSLLMYYQLWAQGLPLQPVLQ